MITKAKVLQAVEDAFIERIKTAYDLMAQHEIVEDHDEVQKQFERSIGIAEDALSRATVVINRIFIEPGE
jgi:hypothetical protein